MTTIQWHRDPQAEAEMERLGLEFDWVEGLDPVTGVSWTKSLANQARPGDVDLDRVALYAQKMRAGLSFPGFMGRREVKGGPVVFVGGNHRGRAARELGGTMDGYVLRDLRIPAATLLPLTWWDNGRHGAPVSKKDLKHQAVQLVDLNYSQAEAASITGLKPNEVGLACRDAAATRAAGSAGIDLTKWDDLPVGVRRDLYAVKTKQGFIALTQLAIDAGLSAVVIGEEVVKMNTTNDALEHEEHVKNLSKIYDTERKQRRGSTGKKGAKPQTTRSIFVGTVRTIMGLKPDAIVSHYSSQIDRASTTDEIDRLIAHLGEIKKALA